MTADDLSQFSLARPREDRVRRIERCRLQAGGGRWLYAERNAAAIDTHWAAALERNPRYFNGTIFLIDRIEIGGVGVEARFLKTDFKSYLYWRETGWGEAGVLDGFGSALLLSAEGDIILGRQQAGFMNAGLTYLPGGFIDPRDAGPEGVIDIEASVARELLEETGLGPDAVARDGALYLTETGPHVSFAVPYRSHLTTAELESRIADHIAADPEGELSSVVVVRSLADLEGLEMAHYARVLTRAILEQRG